VLVKVFRAEAIASSKREEATLLLLAEHKVANVPRLIKTCATVEDALPCLVVAPVGSVLLPLRGGERTTGPDLLALVRVLQHAHLFRVAHRDVKPDNIFKCNGQMILNDWGSSCELGSEILWQGTPGFSDPKPNTAMHVPTAGDDLRALVRSAYALLFLEMPPADASQAAAFWAERLRAGSVWEDAFKAAANESYDELAEIFATLK
jgi:hypothetical protein